MQKAFRYYKKFKQGILFATISKQNFMSISLAVDCSYNSNILIEDLYLKTIFFYLLSLLYNKKYSRRKKKKRQVVYYIIIMHEWMQPWYFFIITHDNINTHMHEEESNLLFRLDEHTVHSKYYIMISIPYFFTRRLIYIKLDSVI